MADRPRARQKNVAPGSVGVHRSGSGHGTGPVGTGSSFGGGGQGPRRSGGRRGGGLSVIAVLLLLLIFGGGRGVASLFSGDSAQEVQSTVQDSQELNGYGGMYSTGSVEGGYEPDRSVSEKARPKYTELKGNGEDIVTLMVYLCGTDLESKNGMATNDLTEMTKAELSDKVNLVVFTGGAREWKNKIVKSDRNQIYQVKDGGLKLLKEDAGSKSMTDPDNLTDFIRFCTENFPANRNMLILWDHGGGSVTGYGYDEKNKNSGSMTLVGLDKALENAGAKFDFIGFDACLMATVETALAMSEHANYLIASEETEPGVGWYYTNWLSALSADPGMSTVDLGKAIVDDFVGVCERTVPRQKTTLSLVDLSELSETLPDEFKAWAGSVTEQIKGGDFKAVSDARQGTKEYAVSSKLDQIDLVHFTERLGTPEGKALADTIKGAVKYNRYGNGMADSNGLSIYFPYQKKDKVDKAIQINEAIGMDAEYSGCIREFAGLQAAAQVASGGQTSPLASLLGGTAGGAFSGGSSSTLQSALQIMQAVNMMAGGSFRNLADLEEGNAGFLDEREMSDEATVQYIAENQFDPGNLKWVKNSEGKDCIKLPEDQWKLVHTVDLNLYVDDGEGYIDLGLDNIYELDEEENLLPDLEGTWLTLNGQAVAYYHTDTQEEGDAYRISGYIPAKLNGQKVRILVCFSDEKPEGEVLGADPEYDKTESETVARGLTEIREGDEIELLCDYYTYEGRFVDSFTLGEPFEVEDGLTLADKKLDVDGVYALYRFTDIYNQAYFSDCIRE